MAPNSETAKKKFALLENTIMNQLEYLRFLEMRGYIGEVREIVEGAYQYRDMFFIQGIRPEAIDELEDFIRAMEAPILSRHFRHMETEDMRRVLPILHTYLMGYEDLSSAPADEADLEKYEYYVQEQARWRHSELTPPTNPHPDEERIIIVDKSDQTLYAFENDLLIHSTPITSGMIGHDTPPGTYAIYSKERDRILRGADYALHVDYWMPFRGGYGIHDACNETDCWRTEFGPEQNYHRYGSHGCINTPYDSVAFIYSWVDIGTPVHIIE